MSNEPEFKMPNIKRMSLEERYDRVNDYSEMMHIVSIYTHRKNGTLEDWVADCMEAYSASIPRFLGPMVKTITKLAPNLALKKTFDGVFNLDQQHHDLEEFEYTEPKNGTIICRWNNCARFKRHKKIVKMLGWEGLYDRMTCDVEKMHLTHPRHPAIQMGFIPTDIIWTDTGCEWHYKKE
jgi:hypothetical protein